MTLSKALEGRLRVFDMSATSRFPDNPIRLGAAARGLLWPEEPADKAGDSLLNYDHALRERIRETFRSFFEKEAALS